MADKDKKLKVILKLPNKSSSNTKGGVSDVSASSGGTSHKLRVSPVTETDTPLKSAGQVSASSANDRVGTPPKKRKFKTLVEGDAKDDHGGVYGSPITTVVGSPVFKAPLPPLAKKPSHKVSLSVRSSGSALWISFIRKQGNLLVFEGVFVVGMY